MKENTIIRYEVAIYYTPQKIYGVRRIYQRTDVKQAISVPANHVKCNHKFVCYLLLFGHCLLDVFVSVDSQKRIKAMWREFILSMRQDDVELQIESV